MITADLPRPVFRWICQDCGKTGRSTTRHGARTGLQRHWRTCPPRDPGGPIPRPQNPGLRKDPDTKRILWEMVEFDGCRS